MLKFLKKIYAGFRAMVVLSVGVIVGAVALDSFGTTVLGWGSCALSIGAGLYYGRKVYRIFAYNDLLSSLPSHSSDPAIIHFTSDEQTPIAELAEQVNEASLSGRVYIYGNQLDEYQALLGCKHFIEEKRLLFNFANELIIGIENPNVTYLNESFLKVIFADLVWVQTPEGKDCYELRGSDVLELKHGKEKPLLRPLYSYDGALFILLKPE